jgi:plasmid maintenance system antidote protein VapI
VDNTFVMARQHNERGGKTTKALQQPMRDGGMAQHEIARRTGIDVGMVNRFLNGSRTRTLATADKVAAALGLATMSRRVIDHLRLSVSLLRRSC